MTRLEPIFIPNLTQAPDRTYTLDFQEFLPCLETLMPVRGSLRVTHCTTYLDVAAQAETIVTLTCDRCLQQYNYRLEAEPTESIWLDEAAGRSDLEAIEGEIDPENLVESVSPRGYFDPEKWLYDQMCLSLPPRQICSPDCRGIELSDSDNANVDGRWAALEALKGQLPQ